MDDHMSLEIVIKSADVFKNVNHFSKMHLYATASLISNSAISSPKQIRTCTDEHSGAQPFWWFPLKFQVEKSKLSQNNLTLVFQVKCRQTLVPDKVIGVVSVNLLELYDSARNHNYPICVAFTITGSRSGKPRGVLYLSYMFQQDQNESKRLAETSITDRGVPSAPPCPLPSAPYFPEDEHVPTNPPPLEAAAGGSAVLPSAPYLPDNALL